MYCILDILYHIYNNMILHTDIIKEGSQKDNNEKITTFFCVQPDGSNDEGSGQLSDSR